MDVTALMTMLDKNRGQQSAADGNLFSPEAAPESKSESKTETKTESRKDAATLVAVAPAERTETGPKRKKQSSARGAASGTKQQKKPATRKKSAAAAPDKEQDTSVENAIPVPASVAVARLQVDRNTRQQAREIQARTQTNSRRLSPVEGAIAPVEYATLATLVAVAVAVLAAIFYLVNDKGEVRPAEPSLRLNQVVVDDAAAAGKKEERPEDASAPASNEEKELLSIISR